MTNGASTAEQKKGLSTLAWIGIGCASLMLIAMIAVGGLMWWGVNKAKDIAADFEDNPLAAVRVIVKMMPEVEEVGVDEEAGTITVRNKKTGEEITVNFEDIKEGRLSFSTDEGEVTFTSEEDDDGGTVNITSDKGDLSFTTGEKVKGERPPWAPVYPDLEIDTQHALQHDTGTSGGVEGRTADGLDAVSGFYKSKLELDGFVVTVTSFSGGDNNAVMLTGTDEAGGRTVIVNASREKDTTKVGVTYNQGK